MLKKLLLSLVLLASFTAAIPAQSRVNRISRPCSGSSTPASVAIDRSGNIAITPCSAKTVTINGIVQPKVYRALLTQTMTDAPVATVLENTLGGTVVWTRQGAGDYLGTLAGLFIEGKTALLSGTSLNVNGDYASIYFRRTNDNVVAVTTTDTGSAADDLLFGTFVQILVFP